MIYSTNSHFDFPHSENALVYLTLHFPVSKVVIESLFLKSQASTIEAPENSRYRFDVNAPLQAYNPTQPHFCAPSRASSVNWERAFEMLPSTTILRTARVLFPSSLSRSITIPLRQPITARTFTSLTSQSLRRPQLLPSSTNGVQEQVRGMKVRSSVKKLCEGCKVCLSPGQGEG